MCPPWYTALLTCSFSAALVGGMSSIERLLLVNSCCLAPFTSVWSLVLSYISMTKCSMVAMWLSAISEGAQERARKLVVTSSNVCQVCHAVILPIPLKEDTVSQPVILWNIGRLLDRKGPSAEAISCDPSHWGWKKYSGGQWEPKWTNLPEASQSCHELLKCGCTKGCKGRCKCYKAALRCTALCKCGGACESDLSWLKQKAEFNVVFPSPVD